jgi:hypothetical protein
MQVGFGNENSLREFVNVEDGIIDPTKKKEEAASVLRTLTPIKENKQNDKEISARKDPKVQAKIKANENNEKAIVKKVTEMINKLAYTNSNKIKLDQAMKSLSLGDQNIFRARWQKIIHNKNSKISIKKKDASDARRTIDEARLELNIVSGNKSDLIKILSIIKNVLIEKNQDKIQIVSLKKDKNRVFKRFSRFLNQNLSGIANYVMPNPSNHTILFKNKNKQKSIKIISINEEIIWKDKIIVLGLEDLKDNDLDDSQIKEVLLKTSLLPSQVVNIIHPNTAEETPGIKYVNNKNDDGSLITKYDEL